MMSSETDSNDKILHSRLGSRLRQAREFLGLSQESVADVLRIPRASVSAIESGKRKVSSVELSQLAKLYRRPIAFFLPDDASDQADQNAAVHALFRATKDLSDDDREQVLRFAEFLRASGKAPMPSKGRQDP